MTNDPTGNAPPSEGSPSVVEPLGSTAAGGTEPHSGGRDGAWTPPRRLTVILTVAMLGIGIAVGSAVGPAPSASFAGPGALPLLLRSLLAARTADTPAAAPPTASGAVEAATSGHRRHRRRRAAAASSEPAAATTPASEPSAPSEPTAPKPKRAARAGKPLPPVTKVWLVELTGSSFGEALAAPASAPFIDSQAIASGALLASWSSLQASAFASAAALIPTNEPQLLTTIQQPPCPEGAAGAACAPDTPGAVGAADAFLRGALATIEASAAYRSNGLIVVTFGLVANGAASELPSGSTSTSLPSAPAAGALLISPFVTAGKRPTTTFTAGSPRQSLEALLHR